MSNRNKRIKRRAPLPRERMAHGYMMYRCRACGRVFQMYLERGLEELDPGNSHKPAHMDKPVPFCIVCRKCGGIAQDVSGLVPLPEPVLITNEMDYFKNTDTEDCGVPVIR